MFFVKDTKGGSRTQCTMSDSFLWQKSRLPFFRWACPNACIASRNAEHLLCIYVTDFSLYHFLSSITQFLLFLISITQFLLFQYILIFITISWKLIFICLTVNKDMHGQTTFRSTNAANECVCMYQNKVKPAYMHSIHLGFWTKPVKEGSWEGLEAARPWNIDRSS